MVTVNIYLFMLEFWVLMILTTAILNGAVRKSIKDNVIKTAETVVEVSNDIAGIVKGAMKEDDSVTYLTEEEEAELEEVMKRGRGNY